MERQLLRGLQQVGPRDFLGALGRLPRNMRILYAHSYQSYVWNLMVSARLELYGLQAVAGDLVLCTGAGEDAEGVVRCEDDEKEVRVRVLTEADAPQHQVQDIVLPLPGYAVVYPRNAVGERYRAQLAADGLDADNMRHKVKDYSLSGGYRKPFAKPRDVSWRIMQYDDYTLPLVLSDLDRLAGKSEPESVPEGRFKALVLAMTLEPSTYATMALREVLKVPTDPTYQSGRDRDKQGRDGESEDVGAEGAEGTAGDGDNEMRD